MYSLWNPMNKSLLENSRMARPSIWPSTRNVQTTGRRLTNLAGMLISGGFDGWFGGKWWWFMVSYGDFWDDLWRIDGWVYLESMRKKVWYDLVYILLSCGRQRVFFLRLVCKMQTPPQFVGRAVRSVAAAFFLWRRPCETKTESKHN